MALGFSNLEYHSEASSHSVSHTLCLVQKGEIVLLCSTFIL